MSVKRYSLFEESQSDWIQLSKTTSHFPFQSFWYNKLFAQKFCNLEDVYILGISDAGKLVGIGAFEVIEEKVLFVGMKQVLGRQDITDYGDILLASDSDALVVWQEIIQYFTNIGLKTIELDYVREDSKTYKVLHSKGSTNITKQDVSPYIELTHTYDEYLMGLDKKDRHELNRKMRRLEKETAFQLCTDQTISDEFAQFVRLHKLSDSEKEKFMSKEMKDVFWSMVTAEKVNWQVHICSLTIENKHVASVFMFVNDTDLLLYNSGFDPAYKYYSVGLLIHAYLIKHAIKEKKKIYDFLRGNERYKYDLGAVDMPLYHISIPLK